MMLHNLLTLIFLRATLKIGYLTCKNFIFCAKNVDFS